MGVLGTGCWVLGAGCWVLGAGRRAPGWAVDTGRWVLRVVAACGCWALAAGGGPVESGLFQCHACSPEALQGPLCLMCLTCRAPARRFPSQQSSAWGAGRGGVVYGGGGGGGGGGVGAWREAWKEARTRPGGAAKPTHGGPTAVISSVKLGCHCTVSGRTTSWLGPGSSSGPWQLPARWGAMGRECGRGVDLARALQTLLAVPVQALLLPPTRQRDGCVGAGAPCLPRSS